MKGKIMRPEKMAIDRRDDGFIKKEKGK